MKRVILALLLTPAIISCASSPRSTAAADVAQVSMQDLLDRPSDFDGKAVEVTGWVTLEPESYNIWKSKSDIDSFNTFNCVSLQNYEEFLTGPSKFNRKKVVATGIFYADVTKDRPMVRLNACTSAAIALDRSRELRLAQ